VTMQERMRPSSASDHVVVIGLGGIGVRHLQGLAATTTVSDVIGVDPSPASLTSAQEHWDEVSSGRSPQLQLVTSLDHVSGETAGNCMVIVATRADVRAEVTRAALRQLEPTGLILEKILFQREQDFSQTDSLLKNHGVPTWVNHPRALSEPWRHVSSMIRSGEASAVTVRGRSWGLACNALHFMERTTIAPIGLGPTIDTEGLSPGSIPASRFGLRELLGTLVVHTNDQRLTMIDEGGERSHATIEVAGVHPATIEEWPDRTTISFENTSTVETYPPLLQSQLTGPLIDRVLRTGECSLPTYWDVSPLHRLFVAAVRGHLAASGEVQPGDPCPIT